MTLTPFDDYPIHQTALPVAHSGRGNRNHYDRYFFNGYDHDGAFYFGFAQGLYPNRNVIDGAFSVLRDGVQRSVFASARAPADRRQTRVGPVGIEIVEPLGTNVLRITGREHGIEADLTWRPRTAAVAEPRQTMLDGHVPIIDATRLVQWGSWEGTITVDGETIEVSPERTFGTKDRSWGLRPVGEPPGGAPSTRPPGIFFLWNPVHFDDHVAHGLLFERADGTRTYESSFTLPLLEPGEQPWGAEDKVAHTRHLEYRLAYRPGTRRVARAELSSTRPDGEHLDLEVIPILHFQMKGIGYLHPEWSHGRWHGEAAEGTDSWRIDELDPLALENIHVQNLCRVRSGDREGIGVLEYLCIGPHAPTGLKDLFDGWEQ